MSFRSSDGGSVYSETVRTLTITAPAGITDGDILVAVVWAWEYRGLVTDLSLPNGWATWYTGDFGKYYGKIAWKRASSESGDYTFTVNAGNSLFIFGQIAAFSGRVASGDPLDVGSNTAYITNNATVRGAGVTIATAGSDLVYVGFAETNGSASLATPSGMTSRRSDDWSGDYTAMETASLDNQSTGATGDKDGTANAATATKHAFLVALKPAVVSGLSIPVAMCHYRQLRG